MAVVVQPAGSLNETSVMPERSDSGPTPREWAPGQRPPAGVRGGSQTVINPERRGLPPAGGGGAALALAGEAGSAVFRRLFPVSADEADGAGSDSAAGVELDHFVIEERIGSGGMGAVFRAVDRRLDRVVALKVLSPGQSHDGSAVQRFRNEARAAARLDHDNIARVYYFGEDKGLQFIAFEFVSGTNIRDLIQRHARLDPVEAVGYTLQIAIALVHTSAAGVVHRDIKPSNIIVTASGRAKLVDLGLARQQSADSSVELTIAGTTLGTFDYISPEQAKDPRNVDVRSDIYSLGCTLYHMLTGEPPYPEGTVLQKLLDHQGKAPPDPRRKNLRVSDQLAAVVRKMMASDPRERHPDAESLVRDLMVVAGGMGLRGLPADGLVWARARIDQGSFWERHFGWIATAAALLVIVSALYFRPFNQREQVADRDFPPASQTQSHVDQVSPANSAPGAGERPGAPEPPAAGGALIVDGPESRGSGDAGELLPAPPLPAPPIPAGSGPRGTIPLANAPAGSPAAGGELATTVPEVVAPFPVAGAEISPRPVEHDPPRPPSPAITIVAADGSVVLNDFGEPKGFPTLEGACAAAPDGSRIELRFDGQRIGPDGRPVVDEPLRIVRKKLTIKGVDGYRPLLRFRHRTVQAQGDVIQIVSLDSATLDVIDVDLQMAVDREVPVGLDEHWALFSLQGEDYLRLQGVTVSIANDGNQPAVVFELVPGTSAALDGMKTMRGTGGFDSRRLDLRIDGSFIRGGASLIAAKHTEPGRIDIHQSGLALDGAMLDVFGGRDSPPEGSELELRLEHVTALLGGGLLRVQTGLVPREMLSVRIAARDSIFATDAMTPLISMGGGSALEDFRRLLRWEGDKNFFDQFLIAWSIAPSLEPGMELDFDEWSRIWQTSPQSGSIVWGGNWQVKEFIDVVPADIRLDLAARDNPPIAKASDGTNAGAAPGLLPVPPAVTLPPQ